MTRVVIAAGGTGGHVFPALAVAAELREAGVEVHFLGTPTGLEARAAPAHGFPLATVAMRGLRGGGWRRWAGLPWSLSRAVWEVRRLLRTLSPDCVLAMGGYVAMPAGLAARLAGCPLVLHEQNAIPGLAVRSLRPFATRIFTGFPEAARRLGPRAEWAGIPVRRELLELDCPEHRYAGRDGPLRILIFGGSQGARFLNQRLPVCLGQVRRPSTVRHQAGERELPAVREAYGEQGLPAETTAFIENMAGAYAWADLAVCRAGAATVAELAAVGLPAVLVPYPFAVDDHQRHNAEALVSRDAAVCMPQQQWQDAAVAERLDAELGDRDRLAAMGGAARELGRPDAASVVARACREGIRDAA